MHSHAGFGVFGQSSAASRSLDRILSADQPWSANPPPVPSEADLAELRSLISLAAKGRTKEATRAVYEHFPLLLRRLFGFSLHSGWLETVSEKPSSHRKALVELVFPNGPIHLFCQNHSKSHLFEFPLSNLPIITQKLICESLAPPDKASDQFKNGLGVLSTPQAGLLMEKAGFGLKLIESRSHSLAKLLVKYVKKPFNNQPVSHVTVPAMMYFLLCVVALPSFKVERSRNLSMVSYQGPEAQYPRVPKRSTSLPSLRALYNYIITGYIAFYKSMATLDSDADAGVFRAAISAYWLNADSPGFPTASAFDSVSCLLLSNRYPPAESGRSCSSLLLDQLFLRGVDHAPNYEFETNGIVLQLLHKKLFEEGQGASVPSFVGAVRLFCILAFPWRASVIKGARNSLLPLEKPSKTKKQTGIAWMNQTLASVGESIGEVVEKSRGSKRENEDETADKEFENGWERFARTTEGLNMYSEMLDRIITLSAELRIGTTTEGLGVIETLACGLRGHKFGCLLREMSRPINLADSISLISEHVKEARKKIASRNRSRAVLAGLTRDVVDVGRCLARAVGVEFYTNAAKGGVMHPFGGDWTHVWGRDGTANGVDNRRHSGGSSPLGAGAGGSRNTPGGLRKRKRRLMGERYSQDVSFLGNAWDRPISRYENEAVVMTAFWLARELEERFHINVNIRWIGNYALWISALSVALTVWLVTSLLFTIARG